MAEQRLKGAEPKSASDAAKGFDRMFVHCFWRNRTTYFLPLAINLDRQIAPQIRFDS